MQWTPDENTPDLVYYQCYTHRSAKVYHDMNACKIERFENRLKFTYDVSHIFYHRYLGWKIHVMDRCDQ